MINILSPFRAIADFFRKREEPDPLQAQISHWKRMTSPVRMATELDDLMKANADDKTLVACLHAFERRLSEVLPHSGMKRWLYTEGILCSVKWNVLICLSKNVISAEKPWEILSDVLRNKEIPMARRALFQRILFDYSRTAASWCGIPPQRKVLLNFFDFAFSPILQNLKFHPDDVLHGDIRIMVQMKNLPDFYRNIFSSGLNAIDFISQLPDAVKNAIEQDSIPLFEIQRLLHCIGVTDDLLAAVILMDARNIFLHIMEQSPKNLFKTTSPDTWLLIACACCGSRNANRFVAAFERTWPGIVAKFRDSCGNNLLWYTMSEDRNCSQLQRMLMKYGCNPENRNQYGFSFKMMQCAGTLQTRTL